MTRPTWRPYRAIFPVRFTHDAAGYMLLHQAGRRRSGWFEPILIARDCALIDRAYMPDRFAARFFRWSEWRGSFDGRPSLWIKKLLSACGCVAQLHMFVRADDPGCFHSHPAFAVRIIVAGGYVEELANGRLVKWKPGRVGLVRPDLEHRIHSLLNGNRSWSIWLRGPKVAKIKVRGC